MEGSVLAGARIRDRRLDLGMRQADLAREAGISASYLNLIEHGRRRIGGRLLNEIARILGTDAARLAEGAGALTGALQAAAATAPEAGAEVRRADDFAGRFPGWAALVAAQAERLAQTQDRAEALAGRLAHDPGLARVLHETLSSITAIRSSAAILSQTEGLDADWQARFLANIDQDARRLTEAGRALALQLEAPDPGAGALPQEQAEAWIEARGHHLPQIEAGQSPEAVVAASGLTGGAGEMLLQRLTRVAEEARRLPLSAVTGPFDPVRIARSHGTDIGLVLRRRAALGEGPPVALAVCDAGGALIRHRPAPGLRLAREGACPLWPLYEALSRPGQPLRVAALIPDGAGERRVLAWAHAAPREAHDPDAPPLMESSMLLLPHGETGGLPERRVGPGCRICPRQDCRARREPSLLR
ncbi:short-chain fatty acyl-CoA regulator family protein [Pseudoroseicyclus aestuarii]|uniref:HTH cro/C1-type domain-containing protein n=1 Tax=Pseudoroseicyclus aestuarii TaxID=1795041 RepID=A0A318SZC0_9RHOB|nr:short-chain fatty acyl-CoA regulator family protein [Pseudoroseicyclus aestuarii]PYE85756.1 hypothetical protein DFP88_101428 [Pseudoroseicyclus aestuarii]